MRYKCTIHITYEINVEADTSEEAENQTFEALSDSISEGIIPLDIFEPDQDGLMVPILERTEISSCPQNNR